MNIFILLMLVMVAIALVDKIANNRFGLSNAFDKGLHSMGSIAISMSGFYCIAIFFLQNNSDSVQAIATHLPIDPSVFIASLLAPDMGGFSIIQQWTNDPKLLILAGVLLTSTLGATISFQLPIFLSSLKKEDTTDFLHGIIYGILPLPFLLFGFAFLIGLQNALYYILPIAFICLILFLALKFFYRQTITCLHWFAHFIRILSIVFFAMIIATLFLQCHFTSETLIAEAMIIVLKMSIIVCGSMVLCEIILRFGKKQITIIAKKLHTNEASIIGLLLSLVTSLAMIPLFHKMDRNGKLMNAAFSVSGAYVLGGQLGFIASVCDSNTTLIYILCKLIGGCVAVVFVLFFERRKRQD